MENSNKELIDRLAMEAGEVVENPQTLEEITESMAEKLAENASRKANSYAYGSGGPTPGESIDNELDRILDVPSEGMEDELVRQVAIMKAKNESERSKRETAAERERKKKEVCDYILYQTEQNYYMKNHFMMDGKTKRRTYRKILRDYDNGKYRSPDGKTLND